MSIGLAEKWPVFARHERAAEWLLMAANPLGDRLHCIAKVLDLTDDAGQGSRGAAALTVLFDDRAEVLVPVERRSADP